MERGYGYEVMRLGDGRDLAWVEVGEPTGVPVMAFHGAPGRGFEFTLYDAVAREHGVRLIAVDRPGYGLSSYQPQRQLSRWPDDIEQLADHLHFERFAVIGHSAGGPHALACARFLSARLLGCGVLSGLAPAANSLMSEGMVRSNRIQEAIYRRWPPSLDGVALLLWVLTIPFLEPLLALSRRDPGRDVDRMMQRMLPPCDRKVVSRPEVRDLFVAEAIDFGPTTLRAAVRDMAICMRAWDFSLDEIGMPVHLWQGDLDQNVPGGHGRHLAQAIPASILHVCPGEGHWLLVDHMAEILRAVVSGAGPKS